ncbi:hypothetical protein PAL_GLEAN10005628 [Pteropus alecto]|uniref:Uncharacterized protein n=1 Tax=Pteropus alecto TaxID=9402 RepID=L5KTT4_PTEAL|nr:hypothetical protein PAL_GLEAN10005628 [Pteropus alecto]
MADVLEANPQITLTPPHGPQIEGCNCQAWRTTGHPQPWPQAPQKAYHPQSNFKSHRKVPGPLQPNSSESAKNADSANNIPPTPSWALHQGRWPRIVLLMLPPHPHLPGEDVLVMPALSKLAEGCDREGPGPRSRT